MASSEYITRLEGIIDYTFRDRFLMYKALIAPGAEGDKRGDKEVRIEYDGNRKLAKVGESIIQLVVRKRQLFAEEHSSKRAKTMGIDVNMKLNPRQRGVADPHTLHLAICAIVGAVCISSCTDSTTISFDDLISTEMLIDGDVTPHPTVSIENLNNNRKLSTELNNPSMPMPRQVDFLENEASVSADYIIEIGDSMPDTFSLSRSPSSQPLITISNSETMTSRQYVTTYEQRTPSSSVGFHEGIDEALMSEVEGSHESSPLIRESSNGSQTVSIAAIENPISSQIPAHVPKKRRFSATTLESSNYTRLVSYIAAEKRRCQASRLHFSEIEFDLALTNCSNISPTAIDLVTLKTLYFAIGSPESLVALQDVLKAQRMITTGKIPKGGHNLSLAERVRVIECITPNIAYQVLQKRCHIYQLFVDSNVGSRKTSDGFVIDTIQSIAKQPITKLILEELYPELESKTEEYRKKRRFVGSLRRLGGRLDLLVGRFGYGILGLLHLPGDYLRSISKAVSEIVSALFYDTLDSSMVYALEKVEPLKILENGRGSHEFVNLIS
ncbi:RNAse iii protein [Rutstroemia sp. NJR-2017a BBW]|nr:RNAse iii protein [Rutstroemia sp. NJR-2017a BBW]